jgi:hypothetical protein
MYEKSVMLEIKNPSENPQKKYEKAMEILEKALGYSSASGRSEISPYKSVRQLTNQSKKMVEKRLLELHNEIVTRWLGLSKAAASFKLSGKIFINPSTGKPLTQAQWKTIKAEVMRAFAYVYNTQEDKIVKTAMSLGKILAPMPAGKAVRATLGSLKPGTGIRILETDPQFRSALQFAQDNAAENMVDLTQRQCKRIHDTVVNAQINRLGPRQLERDLFQKFGEMNRDWRMVAETEVANQVNNGQLITELAKPRPEGDYVYMEGISSPTACPWCASEINGTVVVLLDAPPPGGGDQLVIDDKSYTAIWPGQNNVGRRRSDWWIAAGVQHPHCQCSWIRYTPGYEKERDILNAAIAKATEQVQKEIITYAL